MSETIFEQYRQQVLSQASGEVLEIGFGTGLNLSYYPPSVDKLTGIDVNPGMKKIADKRAAITELSLDLKVVNGENLPFPDERFDSAVSTWTLCSIPEVNRAIAEIYRVLKPNGKFFFIEHGLSEEKPVQVWQNRLTPLQKIIADGCHLNRNIQTLLENHFHIETLERFYAPQMPKTMGYMYKGVAVKS